MDQIEFADGFDTPDTLAFGLGAGQLAVVMAAALAAYSLVRSTLPPVVVDPLAVLLAGSAATLGWLKVSGRPALDWAVFAAQFWMRPRRGTARWDAGGAMPAPTNATQTDDPSTEPCAAADPLSRELPAVETTSPLGAAIPPLRSPPASRPHGARRVTFFSLRGGTGRSTLATELACLLAASGEDDHTAPNVALVDLDLRSPSVAVRLGTPEQTLLDFALAPPDERRVTDFMVTHASGAHVLLGPQRPSTLSGRSRPRSSVKCFASSIWRASTSSSSTSRPELSPLNTTALCACDDVFVVVVPTAGGVQDAYRSTEALRRLGLRHQLRYIVNRSSPGTDLERADGRSRRPADR